MRELTARELVAVADFRRRNPDAPAGIVEYDIASYPPDYEPNLLRLEEAKIKRIPTAMELDPTYEEPTDEDTVDQCSPTE